MRLRTFYPLCLALLCIVLASGLTGCYHGGGPSRPADPPRQTQKAPPPRYEQPGPKHEQPPRKNHSPQPERHGSPGR